jgi:hypothetical protein
VLAGAAYVFTALLLQASGHPVLPLFDGLGPPPPYRWVSPPPDSAAPNEPPLPGIGEVLLTRRPQNFTVSTEDGQGVLAGRSNAFLRQPRQRAVLVNITPLDPAGLGPPPAGLIFDGNAYQFEATYASSGEEAALDSEVQVILRYPRHATVLLKSTGSRWERMKSFPIRTALQIFVETRELGTFVAARPPPAEQRSILPWIAFSGAGAAVIAAAVVLYLRRRSRGQGVSKKRPQAGRPPSKRPSR